MQGNYQNFNLTKQEQTIQMLHDLNCPVHRIGYRHLSEAIPYFSQSPEEKEPEHHVAPMNLFLMVLALVAALLLGLMLGKLISSHRHEKEYETLYRQYCALSQDYDALTINCTALEHAAQEAQSRAQDADRELESQKRLLENRQRELEVLRQRINILEATPETEPTE